MITKDQTKKLIKRIGPNHISKISIYLNQNFILNKFNEPYSDSYISRVLHGNKPNERLEDGIWRYAAELKKQQELAEKRKNEILAPTNPEKQ